MTRLDEFKDFIKEHPLLKEEVNNKKRSWQDIYEEWVLFNDSDIWDKYKIKERSSSNKETKTSNDDMIKTVMGYMKKIDPDKITKYVSSIQKIIELVTSFGAGASVDSIAKKKTGDPLFDRRFDEWY